MIFEKTKKILIISFLAFSTVCCTCILISMILTLVPHISINDWDFLAFVGSIIGGLITWLGVKKTLSQQTKERFLDRYHKEMKELYSVISETRYIINVHLYEFAEDRDGEVDNRDTLRMHADYIKDFIDKMNSKLPELISSVDWKIVHTIELKLKFLAGFLVYHRSLEFYLKRDGYLSMRSVVDGYLDKAVDIHSDLDKYREELMKKYYRLTKGD
ncbi:hypothetical protein [Paenibacillus macerans]|uniref:hypothetical protein n=1 Tax=Paenibacillus macerans TaxID=44252 RepID=UPI003D31856F